MATTILGRNDIGKAVVLGSGQTGNGATTTDLDRGKSQGPVAVEILTTIGATPTVTLALEVSHDGTTFIAAPYSLPATPTTVTVAAPAAITTATTTRYWLTANQPWRFFRITRSANTNVTVTTTVYAY